MSAIVYLITCIPSGKRYVGLTERGLEKRWQGHIQDSRKKRTENWLIARAIRKYGAEAFTKEILYEAVDRREATAVERGLIASYGTFRPGGYNLTSGGDGLAKGFRHTAETCAKMSANRTGIPCPPETKAKIGASNRGKIRTDEVKAKLSAIHTGNPKTLAALAKANPASVAKNKGRKQRPEDIAKRVATRRTNGGFAHTPESIAKIRAKKPPGKTGIPGVIQRGDRWVARASINGKQHHLGTFLTSEEAAHAYKEAVSAS